MRAANRRQHYVPQMYLKRFTEDGFHIYQFDTNTQKSKRYHIRNVCFEDHFYTSAELGSVEGSDPEFECWLSRAESKAGEALKHLLEESSAATDQSNAPVLECLAPGEQTRFLLACFMALQVLRTSLFREWYLDLCRGVHDALGPFAYSSGSEAAQLAEFLERQHENPARAHTAFICNSDALESIACSFDALCEWVMYYSPSGHEMVTSDSPVVRRFPGSEDKTGGYATPGQEIILPISKDGALVLRNYRLDPDKQDNGRMLEAAVDEVIAWNSLQLRQCRRHVYSAKDDFAWASCPTAAGCCLNRSCFPARRSGP